jgi:hypothetical protein
MRRELVAIHEAVRHIRHILEARYFTILTDHKPLTFAFQQKRDNCSPRQFNHLDYISQFTTDSRHISGRDNIVADTLSRVESVASAATPEALAANRVTSSQRRDTAPPPAAALHQLCHILPQQVKAHLQRGLRGLQAVVAVSAFHIDWTPEHPSTRVGDVGTSPQMQNGPFRAVQL